MSAVGAFVAGTVAGWRWSVPPTVLPLASDRRIATASPEWADNPLRSIPSDAPSVPRLRFERRSRNSGFEFRYYGGPGPQRYMTEQNGGGLAVADFDRDGRPDVFCSNGSWFDRPAESAGATSRLFRNVDAWRFRDATASAGCGTSGFGMGCAAGDFDNDGFIDLYVANYGEDRLWRNNGDGTFSEHPRTASPSGPAWTASAAWADFDGDGDLDLFAVNYVEWKSTDEPCFSPHRPNPIRMSCGPVGRNGCVAEVWENNGDGTFRNVADRSAVGRDTAKGLDVVAADLDGDGRLDAYVANDTTPNQLWLNRGWPVFVDEGVARGVALNRDGVASSGMGIGLADGSGAGHPDLVVTNFENEVNDYYRNVGDGRYEPANGPLGLDADSRPLLGFGVAFADFDLDGPPDLFVANGHVWDLSPLGLGHRYRMPALVYSNDAGRRFVRAVNGAGDYFEREWIGRAVARGDLDLDGDLDLVVSHLEDHHELLENRSRSVHEGVRLRCVGVSSCRQPLGCRIEVIAGDRRVVCFVPSGGGFQASSDETLCIPSFGRSTWDAVRIVWPNGRHETWSNVSTTIGEQTLVEGRPPIGVNPTGLAR